MQDRIGELLDSIGSMDIVKDTRWKSNFLNNVAEVFERDGFGTTEAYLKAKTEQKQVKAQAQALQAVLSKMAKYKEIWDRRAIGRAIIKSLAASHQRGRRGQ